MEATKEKNMLKEIERCRVSPPPNSVSKTALRLTFFDVLWLKLPPVQRLFFYHFPNATIATLLPKLKHSLSLALQIFYPLAGNLTHSTQTNQYDILYNEGDSVQLIIAESDSDFDFLIGSHPRDVTTHFHRLIPHLSGSDTLPTPVLALQLTHFPNSGFCIGYSFLHVAADGCSMTHFMKCWASICRTGDPSSIDPLPIYDRTITSSLDWITANHFREMEKVKVDEGRLVKTRPQAVRATFLLSRARIEQLRKWVFSRRLENDSSHVSTFVVTCAHVWSCLEKARGGDVDGERMAHFYFPVDCRARLDPPLQAAYFGNCVGRCWVKVKLSELFGDDGFFIAAESIKSAIREYKGDAVLRDAESWMRTYLELAGQRRFSLAGSPRLRVYDTDFGWGRVTKTEVASGTMALAESRDEEGGVEIGLAMPHAEMDRFSSLFEEGLN